MHGRLSVARSWEGLFDVGPLINPSPKQGAHTDYADGGQRADGVGAIVSQEVRNNQTLHFMIIAFGRITQPTVYKDKSRKRNAEIRLAGPVSRRWRIPKRWSHKSGGYT